ncbi:hypothetical protein C0416_01470 [bacterium]|nr:hypothetical protein [bacterium]
MTGNKLDRITLRKIQKIEDEVIKFNEGKPYVDLQFLQFGVDLMKFLSIEEQIVIRLVVTHPHENAIRILKEHQKETLVEIIENHTIEGFCCFCKEKFTWRDAPMTIRAIHRNKKGTELHHSRCYPKNCRYTSPTHNPHPIPASEKI